MTIEVVDKPTARLALAVAASATWGATVVNLVTGLARGKVAAVTIGPSGVGFVGQLNSASTLVASVAVGLLASGAVREVSIARAQNDRDTERLTGALVLLAPIVIGVPIAVAFALEGSELSTLLLGTPKHAEAVAVAGAAVPAVMAVGSYSSLLQAEQRLTRLAFTNVIVASVVTAVVCIFVWRFGLNGGIASVAVTSLAAAAIFATRERRRWQLLRGIAWRRAPEQIRHLAYYGIASVVVATGAAAGDLGVRTALLHDLGMDAAGLYQPVTMLSSQVFLALVTGVGMYLYPHLSRLIATGQHKEATDALNGALRFLTVVVALVSLLTIVFAPFLLTIAFSSAFLSAVAPLQVQASGEVLRAVAWTAGAVLLPLGLVRQWVLTSLVGVAVQTLVALLLVGRWGLIGAAVGFVAGGAANAAVTLFIVRRQTRFRLEKRVVAMLAAMAFAVGLELFGARTRSGMFTLAALAAVSFALRLVVKETLGDVYHRIIRA